MEVYDLFEENELDTYIRREVLVLEGDEAQSLTQEELGQGQEDHCWFNCGSTCTTSVFPKDTEYFLFLDQGIWREEHRSKYDLKKLAEEEVKNAEVVMATLNGLPESWNSFIQGMCSKREVMTFSRLIRREEKMGAIEDQALTIQVMRNMKNSTLEELLILLIIWIRNDAIMNKEDDEYEGSRRSLPMKKIKISIQLSFHDIFLLCILLGSDLSVLIRTWI